MRKLLFVLVAALAFVACKKEENSELLNSTPPEIFTLTPNIFNAEAGTIIKIKTPVPSCNMYYINENDHLLRTGVNQMPTTFPATYENDLYSLVQTSDDTFEICIKAIDKACIFHIKFSNTDKSIGHPSGAIRINYALAE